MNLNPFKILRKKRDLKSQRDDLEKALEQGLITEEEVLRLNLGRAEELLQAWLKVKSKKK